MFSADYLWDFKSGRFALWKISGSANGTAICETWMNHEWESMGCRQLGWKTSDIDQNLFYWVSLGLLLGLIY